MARRTLEDEENSFVHRAGPPRADDVYASMPGMTPGDAGPEDDEPDEGERVQPQAGTGYDPEPAVLVGQPTEVPIWSEALKAPEVYKLKVMRIAPTGDRQDLGTIPVKATEYHLLEQWPTPGTYMVMPVNQVGRNLLRDPIVKVIPSDHAFFRQRAAAAASTPGGGFTSGGLVIPPEVWKLVAEANRRADEANARADRLIAELRADADRKITALREELLFERGEIAKERLSLAVQNTDSALEVHEKLLEKDAERQARAQETVTEAIRASREAERERFEAELASTNKLHETVLGVVSKLTENEQKRLEQEAKRLEADARRREDEAKVRVAEAKADAEKQLKQMETFYKQLSEARLEARENSDPIAMVERLMDRGGPVVDLIKAKIGELFGGGGGSGEPKSIPQLIAETIQTVIQSNVQMAALQQGMMPPGMEPPDDGTDEPDDVDPIALLPPPPPAQPSFAQQQQALNQRQPVPAQPTAAPPVPPAPGFGGTPLPPQPGAVAMDLQRLKVARQTVAALVRQLRATPQAGWMPVIAGALATPPAGECVVEYLRKTSIRRAILECGGDDGLASTVIVQVDNMGLAREIPRN